MIKIDGIELFDRVKPYWHNPLTLALILLVTGAISAACLPNINLNSLSVIKIGIIVGSCILMTAIWFFTTKLPKASRNSIGLAIALTAETKEQQQRLHADLVASLRKALTRIACGKHSFQLIEVPASRASDIQSVEHATVIREKTRCKFILWGTAKIREINGVPKHVLDMQIQISHRPIPTEVSKAFANEISTVFPGKLHLDQKNDLMLLEFTSEWLESVARYLAGVAFGFSGFVDAAESVFQDLAQNRILSQTKVPQIRNLKALIRQRTLEIYDWRINQYYESWRSSRSQEDVEHMKQYLSSLSSLGQNTYSVKLLTSICLFVDKRDVKGAIAVLNSCNDIDATWRYNLAFLHAYDGNMDRARRTYRAAFERSCIRSDIPIQTEEFMLWVLSQEPDKGQLHFCLGLVNWHAKEDLEQAACDFQNFRASGLEAKFPEEHKFADIYIKTLNGEIASVQKRAALKKAD